jgi:hypothetical protein
MELVQHPQQRQHHEPEVLRCNVGLAMVDVDVDCDAVVVDDDDVIVALDCGGSSIVSDFGIMLRKKSNRFTKFVMIWCLPDGHRAIASFRWLFVVFV